MILFPLGAVLAIIEPWLVFLRSILRSKAEITGSFLASRFSFLGRPLSNDLCRIYRWPFLLDEFPDCPGNTWIIVCLSVPRFRNLTQPKGPPVRMEPLDSRGQDDAQLYFHLTPVHAGEIVDPGGGSDLANTAKA